MALSSVHQHNPDCDIWVHEYFTPSWFCLPNNQPALTVIRPGDTTRDVLEMICKVKAASVPWSRVKGVYNPEPFQLNLIVTFSYASGQAALC